MSVKDLLRGMKEMNKHDLDYQLAMDFYEGEIKEIFTSERLEAMLKDSGSKFRINLAKVPVNAVVDRLEINSITVPGNDKANTKISEIRKLLDLDIQEINFHRKTSIFGDAYALVLPADNPETPEHEEDEDDTLDDDELMTAGLDVYYNSPLCMRVIYDEERPTVKAFAIKRWRVAGEQDKPTFWRVNIYYANTIEKWQSKSGSSKADQESDWQHFFDEVDMEEILNLLEEEPEWPIVTNYGQLPVFHFRNDLPYGSPVHKDAYGPQNAVNKLVITQMAATDSHGFPQRWALTETGMELDSNNDDPDWDDDDRADDSSENMQGGVSSSMRSGPGTLTMLNNVKSVGSFETADPADFLEPLTVYVKLMSQTCTTPLRFFYSPGSRPSGESLRAEDAPLVKKTRVFQMVFSTTWSEMWRFMLKLSGIKVQEVNIQWAPAAMIEDSEGWAVSKAKNEQGVPESQTLQENGYTEAQLAEWGVQTPEENKKEIDRLREIETFFKLSEAMEKFAPAVVAGAIHQDQVQALFAKAAGLAVMEVPGPVPFDQNVDSNRRLNDERLNDDEDQPPADKEDPKKEKANV